MILKKKSIIALSILSPLFAIFGLVSLFLMTPLSTIDGAEAFPLIKDEIALFVNAFVEWFTGVHILASTIMITILVTIVILALVWLVGSIVKKHARLIWSLLSAILTVLLVLFVAVVFFSQQAVLSLFNNTVLDPNYYPAARFAGLFAVGFILLAGFLCFIQMIVNCISIFRKVKDQEVIVSDDPLVLVQHVEGSNVAPESAAEPVIANAFEAPKVLGSEPVEEKVEEPVKERPALQQAPSVQPSPSIQPMQQPCQQPIPSAINGPLVVQYFNNGVPTGSCPCGESSCTCNNDSSVKSTSKQPECSCSQVEKRPVELNALLEIMHNELFSSKNEGDIHTIIPGVSASAPIIIEEQSMGGGSLDADEVRSIIREELNDFVSSNKVAPKAEQTPVVKPVVVAPVVAASGESSEEGKIIRIPFTDRIVVADQEMKDHFNELKSEIMAYGMHSRVSNSGDTFRLHTKTFVKITIAGKSLKLYLALNPKDYADSTLPIIDAGHKGIYKDIPLVFKVKSELSLRRAKQLIADVMEKDKIDQQKVEAHDWVKDIKNNNY